MARDGNEAWATRRSGRRAGEAGEDARERYTHELSVGEEVSRPVLAAQVQVLVLRDHEVGCGNTDGDKPEKSAAEAEYPAGLASFLATAGTRMQ